MSWELELKAVEFHFAIRCHRRRDFPCFSIFLSLSLSLSFSLSKFLHSPTEDFRGQKKTQRADILQRSSFERLAVSGVCSGRIQRVRKSRIYLQDYHFRSLKSRVLLLNGQAAVRSTTWKFFYSYVSRFEKGTTACSYGPTDAISLQPSATFLFTGYSIFLDFLAHLKHLSIERLLSLNLFFTFLWFLPVKIVVDAFSRENISPRILFNS